MGSLVRESPWTVVDASVIDVLDQFSSDDRLQVLPVLNEALEPLGLVARIKLIEIFSKPYSRELNKRHSVSVFMENDPVIVDESTSIDDLARILVYSGDRHLSDGFIVTRSKKYIGVGNFLDLLSEIIERKQAHLYQLAHYDVLCSLPNRHLFMDRLQKSAADLGRSDIDNRKIAVVFIDLDRFKQVNDTLGHAGGDELLKQMAQRLIRTVRDTDTVARLGGDEFTVLLTNIFEVDQVERVLEKLFRALRDPFLIDGHTLEVTASLGVALTDSKDELASELVRKADLAMYSAKASGKNTYAFYQEELTEKARERLMMEAALKAAIRLSRFEIHYQPVIQAKSGQLVSLEALLRWHDPDMGTISPAIFIPLAEQLGLIEEIDSWVLDGVCRQIIDWQASGLSPMVVSVNLSALEICNIGFAERMSKLLAKTGVNPGLLKIEVTESHILESPEVAIEMLEHIRAMGIRISLDDFGTGYSSLSYIKRLPIDELKIDSSFIRDVVNDIQDQAIVEVAVTLARKLGITTVAEGVETAAQAAKLAEQGCDAMQGFFYSRPIPAAQVPGLVAELPHNERSAFPH